MKQECIPVGCVPPTRYHTGRGLCLRGVSITKTPLDRYPPDRDPPPGQRPPWTETHLDHVTCGACWDRDPPVDRILDTHYLAATSLRTVIKAMPFRNCLIN